MRYEWEQLFAPQILERGRGYFDEGAVTYLRSTDNRTEAKVSGTRAYHVKITFAEGKVSELYCGCPYAERGQNCKHMAAVLYELERMRDGHSEGDVVRLMAEESDSAFLKKLLDCSLPELRDFLRVEAQRNEALKNRFLARCLANDKNVSAKLRREVYRISYSCFGSPCTVSAEKLSDYAEKLCGLLELFVPVLLEQRNAAAAFDLVCAAVIQTGGLTEYSEDSSSVKVAECCRKHWNRILESAFEAQRKDMIRWFYDSSLNVVKPSWNFLIREFLPKQEDCKSISEKIKRIEACSAQVPDLRGWNRKEGTHNEGTHND